MTTALAVIAVCCAAVGLTGLAADWWTTRQAKQPAGRHRAGGTPLPGLSATRLLLDAKAAADRAPVLPRPTREQLRQAGGQR